MTISNYIKQLLAVEEYAFSMDELIINCNKSETALRSDLSRLVQKKEIVNLRKGFYLIIPPRYSSMGQIPIQLFVDKLFKKLSQEYYLGLFSAAKFHGASHQQIQRDYVITSLPPILDIKKSPIDIRFFTLSNWPPNNLLDKKSDAGFFKISSPVLTAIDLIHHQNKVGGINRIVSVLEELAEEMDPKDLSNLLKWYPHKSGLQRFGFLLEQIKADELLTNTLFDHLISSKYFPILLSPTTGQKPGIANNKWKVGVNISVDL